MGVRFYDNENMSTGGNYTTSTRTSCNCNTCNHETLTSSTTSSTNTTATQTTHKLNNGSTLNFQKSGVLREIVGNSKDVKIEDNSHNLRIVGNNNRIRVTFNVGDITIIGNNTRLKIKINHGHIQYTGNDGRISLGKDSTEQLVDYSGCNGVLKVQNSKKSSQESDGIAVGSTGLNEKLSYRKGKEKYASYNGLPSDSKVFKSHTDYNNIFNRKKSMPNIAGKPFHNENASGNRDHQLQKHIVHNFGNIVIANSSNICISPYSYTY